MQGSLLNQRIREVELWTYTSDYPPQIEVDCSNITFRNSYRIGDVEATLPDGVFLHKKYVNKRNAVVNLQITHNVRAKQFEGEKAENEFKVMKE